MRNLCLFFVFIYPSFEINYNTNYCIYNNIQYSHGETFHKGESGCTVCTCFNGTSDICYTVKYCNDTKCTTKSKALENCCRNLECEGIFYIIVFKFILTQIIKQYYVLY